MVANNRNLEQRVADLEKQVADLASRTQPRAHWIDLMKGSMNDFPDFEEVVRLGAEYRRSLRPPEDAT